MGPGFCEPRDGAVLQALPLTHLDLGDGMHDLLLLALAADKGLPLLRSLCVQSTDKRTLVRCLPGFPLVDRLSLHLSGELPVLPLALTDLTVIGARLSARDLLNLARLSKLIKFGIEHCHLAECPEMVAVFRPVALLPALRSLTLE